jgi:alpha-L-fucosidase
MINEDGSIRFNGPFPRVLEWVALSREIGLDYHSMEIKWHDGICYFNTKLTKWKTGPDYARLFAEESRKAGIPFIYYYSSVFDHSPKFDDIQPHPHQTESYIALGQQPLYEEYLLGQYREIMEQCDPDGIWLDWYWPDRSTEISIDFFRKNYPDKALAFNFASYFPSSYKRLDFSAGEAHDLTGPYIKFLKSANVYLPVWCSAWKWSTFYRRFQEHSSEIISPAGRWWSDPSLRDDPNTLLRMSAIVMASGMKHSLGVTSQMDGSIYPDQVKQLRMLGAWYLPRKMLFTESVPLSYRGREPRTVNVDNPKSIKIIACRHEGDILIHLINMDGSKRPLKVTFREGPWEKLLKVTMEPSGRELPVERVWKGFRVTVSEEIDPVDTILRIQ